MTTQELQQLIDSISAMPDAALIATLDYPQMLVRYRAIAEVARRRLREARVKTALLRLTQDNMEFWKPYRISDYARAALHHNGLEAYQGDDANIKRLIEQLQVT